MIIGSISVSGQLRTYPSPNPTFTLTCYQFTVVGLGEGWVGSCLDTDIDPIIIHLYDPVNRNITREALL